MKNAKIVMGALALAVVAATIIACNKEKADNKNHSEEIVLKEDDMSAYLKQFKKKMQSAEKGGETLSMEDACWHLEAVLNYTYGDAGHQTTDIQCDTFYYRLQTHGDEVTLAQLNNAYNALSHDVDVAYGNCDLPEKSVLAIQTLFEEESGSDEVVVRGVLNTRGYRPLNMWFDSTDYWNERYYDFGDGWIDSGGKCGPYEGEHPESGAPLELTRKLNLRISEYGCPYGNGYFTDIFPMIISIFSPDIPESDVGFLYDENSPCRFKLYYRTEDPHCPWASNPDGCICPVDMNYYLSKGLELINHYIPEGTSIVGINYQSNIVVGLDDSEADNCYHELVLRYGAFHCDSNGGGMDD